MDWEPTGKWGIILRPLLEIASTTTHDAFALFSSTWMIIEEVAAMWWCDAPVHLFADLNLF